MQLDRFDHLLIQSPDLEATRAWYIRTLGLTEGPHPDFKFPVCWLYSGAKDVIHLTRSGAGMTSNQKKYLGEESGEPRGGGVIHHVAFRCSGLRETLEHLANVGVAFTQRQVDDQALYQLFLSDPNGVGIELNFDSAEAQGIAPGLMASSLPEAGR